MMNGNYKSKFKRSGAVRSLQAHVWYPPFEVVLDDAERGVQSPDCKTDVWSFA